MKDNLYCLLFVVLIGCTFATTVLEFTLVFDNFQSNGNQLSGTAKTQTITTTLSDTSGPTWSGSSSGQQAAVYSSTVIPDLVTLTYMEYGNITFSEGNVMYFNSTGYTGSFMGKIGTEVYGAIHYKVTGGTGAFAGAEGAMTDIFTGKPIGGVELSVWGKAWVQ